MLKVKINAKVRVSIVAILAVLLILMTVVITIKRGLPMVWDTRFHIGRIYDIREAFLAHRIPTWVNFSSYHGMGQAINGMYPDITLWPFILITNGLSFVNQIIAIKVVILLATFIVTYISLVKHNFIKENSFYVAILYVFTGYSLYQFLYELQPGAIAIYIFTFPLVFSIEEVLYTPELNKKLIVKLSLLFGIILYSHLLSAVVIACLIISMWLLRVVLEKKLNYFSILNLFLASILTFFYSMPILYRLYVISQSKIAPPYGKGLVDSESLNYIFNDPQIYARVSLSFVALLLFIISLHYFGKNSKITRYLIGEMVIILLCSNLIPWNILGKLPLINMFQFTPWRFGIYLSALPMLAFLYTHIKNKNMILFVLSLISLAAVPEALSQNNSIFKTSQCTFINSKALKADNSNQNFGSIIRDYLPAKTIGNSINGDVPNFAKRRSFYPKIEGPQQESNVKKVISDYGSISLYNQKSVEKGVYTIPVYYYSSLKYRIYVNGKKISKIAGDHHGFMKIKFNNLLQRNSKIVVIYNNPKFYNALLVASLAIYLFVIIYFIKLDNIGSKERN